MGYEDQYKQPTLNDLNGVVLLWDILLSSCITCSMQDGFSICQKSVYFITCLNCELLDCFETNCSRRAFKS